MWAKKPLYQVRADNKKTPFCVQQNGAPYFRTEARTVNRNQRTGTAVAAGQFCWVAFSVVAEIETFAMRTRILGVSTGLWGARESPRDPHTRILPHRAKNARGYPQIRNSKLVCLLVPPLYRKQKNGIAYHSIDNS